MLQCRIFRCNILTDVHGNVAEQLMETPAIYEQQKKLERKLDRHTAKLNQKEFLPLGVGSELKKIELTNLGGEDGLDGMITGAQQIA